MSWFFKSAIAKFCVIAAVTSTSVWSTYFGSLEMSMMSFTPAFIICLYGLIACWYVRSERVVGDSIASFTYFLGYLCTIVALTVLVARLGDVEGGFLNVKAITVAISVALTTTIAGLVFMTLIRDIHSVDSEATKKIVDRLEGVISSNKDAFNNLYKECDRTAKSLAAMRTDANSLTQIISSCSTAIGGTQTKFDEYAGTVGECVEKIEALSGSIKKLSEYKLPDNVRKALEKTITGVSDLDEKCKIASANVNDFSTSVDACAESVSSMDSNVSENTEGLKEFYKAVKELGRILGAFAKLMEGRIGSMHSPAPYVTRASGVAVASQRASKGAERKNNQDGHLRPSPPSS